jgi:adenine-specific DNA glycosylase
MFAGLLAGLWEFPTSDLTKEPKTSELLDASRQIVHDVLPGLSESDYHPVTVGNVLHLFSHIRKTYYGTSVVLRTERPTKKLPKDRRWIRVADFQTMKLVK